MERGRTRVIRKKGFSFMSFLLGILFGMILLLGAVGGAIAFVLFTDLDTVFSTVGLENKDEEGNYVYINTDPEDGGAKTVLDLVTVVTNYASDFGGQSLGELEHILPAVSNMVNGIFESFNEYVEVDLAKLRETKFGDIGDFISDTVMDIRPAKLISDFGVETDGDGVASTLMSAIVYGKEADYVTVDGVRYPVRYDEAEANGEVRTARDAEPDGEGKTTYKIYFYEKDGENYLLTKNTDGSYAPTGDKYQNPKAPRLTGNYYYENGDSSTDRIIETPITLRVLTSDDGMQEILDGLYITDLINQDEGVIGQILGGISVGAITSGEVDINEKIQSLEITTIIDIDPESPIMTYLGYGISTVVAAEDGHKYQYTAALEGEPVYVCASEGKITGVYKDENCAVEIKGTSVREIGNRIDSAKIDAFMDISPDNKMMMYIAYGVSGVAEVEGEDYNYTGTYRYSVDVDGVKQDYEMPCYIISVGGKISRIFVEGEDGEQTIEACAISQVGNRVNDVRIDLLLDIEVDSAVLMYMGYGVSGVVPAEGSDYQYIGYYHTGETSIPCYISAEGKKVRSVYYKDVDDAKISVLATGINDITDRVKGITNDLSIAEFMDIKPDNVIMMYIAYGVSGLNGLTGTYKVDENTSKDVTIQVDEKGNAEYVYYVENGERVYLQGTSINGIGDRVSSFKDDLTVGEVLDVDGMENPSKIITALKDSKIGNIDTSVQELKLGEFLSEEDENENKSSVLDALKGTRIKDISKKINTLSLQELYPENIYRDPETGKPVARKQATTYVPGYIYYTENEGVVELVNLDPENPGKLTEDQFNNGTTYYTYGELSGVWKFLLGERTTDGENTYYDEKICALNQIGGLIDGAAGNINNASLGELQRAGIISDQAVLEGELQWQDAEGNKRTTELKKMSLADLITAVSYIAEQQSKLPQLP